MKTVTVSICTGTTCYLMGASHLQRLDEELDEATWFPSEIATPGKLDVGYRYGAGLVAFSMAWNNASPING